VSACVSGITAKVISRFYRPISGEIFSIIYELLVVMRSRLVIPDHFLSRVSILTRDIEIVNLSVRPSVRYVPVSDENGLTYRHSFFTIR